MGLELEREEAASLLPAIGGFQDYRTTTAAEKVNGGRGRGLARSERRSEVGGGKLSRE